MPVRTFRQGWGKVRRYILIALYPARVERALELRRGECNRCGASCKLLFRCPAFDDSDGSPKCMIYDDRPGICGLFPMDPDDLADRDLVSPRRPCGYAFGKERRPISQEDRRRLYSGRRLSLRGTLNIVRYMVLRLGRPNGRHGSKNLATGGAPR